MTMRATQIALGVTCAITLAACSVHGTAIPAALSTETATTVPATTTTPPPTTVQPPVTHTVYVQPPSNNTPAQSQWYAQPSWIDSQPPIAITPTVGQTACQWLYANGYSYAQAFAAWAQNGYPANWSATNDGYPCQRTYGMQH
jgi:hypothetical protein